MADPFEASCHKIARAKARMADLERQAEVFWQTNERSVIVEPNPEHPNEEIHKLKFAEPLPPHLADITADAVHDLRSSLDDAMYSVAVATGKVRPKYATFPFGRNAVVFENNLKTRCKDIPKGLYPLFRAYQPYRGGDYALWELDEISVTDKQKLLGVGLLGDLPGGVSTIIDVPWDSLKNEFIFEGYSVGAGAAGFKDDDKQDFAAFVAFDDVPDRFRGKPVLETLGTFVDVVEHFLLGLEAESRRLGYIA